MKTTESEGTEQHARKGYLLSTLKGHTKGGQISKNRVRTLVIVRLEGRLRSEKEGWDRRKNDTFSFPRSLIFSSFETIWGLRMPIGVREGTTAVRFLAKKEMGWMDFTGRILSRREDTEGEMDFYRRKKRKDAEVILFLEKRVYREGFSLISLSSFVGEHFRAPWFRSQWGLATC